MPRDIPIGNGNILIAFDRDYQLREFSYPHVGEESHTKGEPFRLGVWVNGRFSWLPHGWQIRMDYLDDALATNVELINDALQLRIAALDLVDFHENIYFRKLVVTNLADEDREVRLFLTHDFHIYNNEFGNTAAYRPETGGMHHYKGERHFLINVYANKKFGIDHFATGNKEFNNNVGTWRDAEDGLLSSNPIAQGSVDSVIGIPLRLKAGEQDTIYSWICVGRNWIEVSGLNSQVTKRKPETFIQRTVDYWKLWSNKEEMDLLRNISFLKDLSTGELIKVNIITENVSFAEGEEIMQEGAPCDAIYIVKSGSVRIMKGGAHLDHQDPLQEAA